jgi:hypothetical protein
MDGYFFGVDHGAAEDEVMKSGGYGSGRVKVDGP